MLELTLNGVPTLFIQGFQDNATPAILSFVQEADSLSEEFKRTVLFIDTPAASSFVEAVASLKRDGYRVVYRDHHGVEGEPTNVRDSQKIQATEKLRELLGDDCQIVLRSSHPACSTLVEVGEFEQALAIIADPDADGLTAAMKAAGLSYEGLDEDAALLDGEPAFQVTGTHLSSLLAKGLATLPKYDSRSPHEREETQQKLFERWVKAVEGDKNALKALSACEKAYDEAVRVADKLATRAKVIAPGVVLVDVTDSPVFDVGRLSTLIESDPQCRISVLRKDKGPIAALHGIQYSLSVASAYQGDIDLRSLLPPAADNNPASGIISNVSFLLHVSEEFWEEHLFHTLCQLYS